MRDYVRGSNELMPSAHAHSALLQNRCFRARLARKPHLTPTRGVIASGQLNKVDLHRNSHYGLDADFQSLLYGETM